MTMMMRTLQNNKPKIFTVSELQQEQRRLRKLIKVQEQELRAHVHRVPGELFYSGVNAVIPSFLEGKITRTVLNAGRSFLNNTVIKKGADGENHGLITAAKQAGLFTLLRVAYKAFMRKKS